MESIIKILKLIFVKNIRNKVTALIFALAIWNLVSFEVSEEYTRDDIILEIQTVRAGVPITDIRVEPEQIILRAKFTCPRRIGQQYLSPAVKLKAVHVLEAPKIGEPILVEIERENFNLPADLHIVSVEPASIQVILRKVVAKRLGVEASLRGKPADGYEIQGKPVIEPTEVTVKGLKEVIEPLTAIPTEDIITEGRSTRFTSDYSIVDKIEGTKIECSTKVRVTVSIVEKKLEAVFNIPVFVLLPPDYKNPITLVGAGTDNTIPLKLKGPKSVIESPELANKLTAFVIITSDLAPRPGVAYYRPLFLTSVAGVRDIELAEEKQIGVEIGELPKPSSEEPKSP
ncbi:MAG: CdaR family protein [Planctomycetota bacterium]